MRVKEIALPYLSVHGCARDSRELRRAGVVWCVVRWWLRAMRLASFAANFWATLELGEGEGGGAVSRSLSDAAHVAGDGCRRAWVALRAVVLILSLLRMCDVGGRKAAAWW